MSRLYRVALLGFSDFERSTLASCFRLAGAREPAYTLVPALEQAQFAVADADHAPTVRQVTRAQRVDDSVFIGRRPPPAATVWMLRPIDPLHVMRELDAMAALLPMPSPPPAPPFRPAPCGPQPVVVAPAADAAPRAAAPGKPRALLVDDSEIARVLLASRLQRWGVACTHAPQAARALELLAQQHFDLVFIDVDLGPDSVLDGLSLCQHVRRQHPLHGATAPWLALVSAHHTEIGRARGTLAGADAYLGKPLQDAELSRLLRRQGLKPADGAAP